MDEWVKRSDYATAANRLCFGVVVTQSDLGGTYEYHLRFNKSRQPGEEDIPPQENIRVRVIEK